MSNKDVCLDARSLSTLKVTKRIAAMGTYFEISKLTLGQVEAVQELNNDLDEKLKSIEDPAIKEKRRGENGLAVSKFVIIQGCAAFADFSDDDFKNVPLDEVLSISKEILTFSGLSSENTAK